MRVDEAYEEALADMRNKNATLKRKRDRAEKSHIEERNNELEEAEKSDRSSRA